MSFHDEEIIGSLHYIHNFEYADATARTGATGMLPADVGKVARQLDDESFWVLQDDSPVTWMSLTAGGGSLPAHANSHQHGGADEVATATPAANAIPKADGTGKLAFGWLPVFGQDYQTEISVARSTTTSTTYQTKVTLTTPALTGTYRVGWTAVVDQVSIVDSVRARLYNATDAANVGAERELEPHDVDDRISIGGFAEVIFTGSAKSFSIQWRQVNGNTAGIQDARIEFWRVA